MDQNSSFIQFIILLLMNCHIFLRFFLVFHFLLIKNLTLSATSSVQNYVAITKRLPNARGWKATRHPSWLHKTQTKIHTKTNRAVCHEAWLSTVWIVIISIKVSSISSLSECWKDPWAVYRVLKPDNRLTTFTFPTFLHHFQSFFVSHKLCMILSIFCISENWLFLFYFYCSKQMIHMWLFCVLILGSVQFSLRL